MAGDGHTHILGHTRVAEVARGRAAEAVERAATLAAVGDTDLFARALECLIEVEHRCGFALTLAGALTPMKHERTHERGPALRGNRPGPPASLDNRGQFTDERHGARLLRL